MADKEEHLVGIMAYVGKNVPKEYLNLIRTRWVRTYRTGNGYMKIVHPPSYYFAYQNYIRLVLERPDTMVRLAVLEEDQDVVLGFSVSERNILHYVHVPRSYRRQGIGGMLVPPGIEWTTHLTEIGMKLWSMKMPGMRFNPFL